jgi:hypothetical protein
MAEERPLFESGDHMRIIFILAAFLMTGQLPAQTREEIRREPGAEVVSDSVVIKNVLKAVTVHVQSVTKNRRRALVVKEGKKSRRFIVMDILGSVYLNKNIYTAQLDTDEFDHKIPRILYVDVKSTKGIFKVTKIRIGPNRFRDL